MKHSKPLKRSTATNRQRRSKAKARERARDEARDFLKGGWRKTNPPARIPSSDRPFPGLRGFTQRVFALYGTRCIVCRRKAVQAHHVVALRTIMCRADPDADVMACDARNGVPVCKRCHERHESAFRRIQREELPLGVIMWARENDFGWFLERHYPRKAA